MPADAPRTDGRRADVPGVDPRAPKVRPDPRPMRLAIGFTGLAAATAMATAIVRPPAPPTSVVMDAPPDLAAGMDPGSIVGDSQPVASASTAPTTVAVRHVTKYVQLRPGQTAPPGAKVVTKPDPSPRVVIVNVPAPTVHSAPAAAAPVVRPAPRRVVVVTRQSGG